MKSKVFKFFGNLVACFVLIFGTQLSCFAIEPVWNMDSKNRMIFSSLPEAIQVELNKMSDYMYQNKLRGVSDANNLVYFLKHINLYYSSFDSDLKAVGKDNQDEAIALRMILVRSFQIVGFCRGYSSSDHPKFIINTRLIKNFTHSSSKTAVASWVHELECTPKRSVTEEDGIIYKILKKTQDNIEFKRWSVHFVKYSIKYPASLLTIPADHISKPFYLSYFADEIFPIHNKIKLYDTNNNLDKFLDPFKK